MSDIDKAFTGSIAEVYETYFVPLIFAPYARDLAPRVAAGSPRRILEIAAGTGVVTRALRELLPPSAEIVATDLNQAMLDVAAKTITSGGRVEWRQADAMALPFEDASFDAVVCQFGVMFFPDKAKAYAETRRVLRPGGTFHFNVWDRIADNEFTDVVTEALATIFPADPPRFMARTPHGYHDIAAIARDLRAGGFDKAAKIETIAERSRAPTARQVAIAICTGSPLRSEIEARAPGKLENAVQVSTAELERRYGAGPVDGKIQAHVVAVAR
ncbi:MAG TPA: methyltransferase domain-containing protein [Caldimonas sp.]|nr:methyltransferase domain-containing protein [Caldimonas sp.]